VRQHGCRFLLAEAMEPAPDELLENNLDMPSWSPGFSRLDTCLGSGILPETPDPAKAGTPIQRMSALKIQRS